MSIVTEHSSSCMCKHSLKSAKPSLGACAPNAGSCRLCAYNHCSEALTVIMQARLGEKETLDVTLRYFEDRKSKLDRLEYYQERRLKGLGLLDDEGNNTWDDFFKDSIA